MYNCGMMNDLDEDLEVLDRVPFDLDAAISSSGAYNQHPQQRCVIRYIKL